MKIRNDFSGKYHSLNIDNLLDVLIFYDYIYIDNNEIYWYCNCGDGVSINSKSFIEQYKCENCYVS